MRIFLALVAFLTLHAAAGDIYSANGFNRIAIRVLTTSQTYNRPAGLVFADVECVGAGGGAGGTGNAPAIGTGGSGGGGSYARRILTADEVGASQAVVVGTGGPGFVGNGDGTFGTDSSFGAFCIGKGGAGGGGSPAGGSAAGGAGGTGGTGTLTINGGPGSRGSQGTAGGVNMPTPLGGHSGNGFGFPDKGLNCASRVGTNGLLYGAGGNGGVSCGSFGNGTGGAGANGVVVVTEYLR